MQRFRKRTRAWSVFCMAVCFTVAMSCFVAAENAKPGGSKARGATAASKTCINQKKQTDVLQAKAADAQKACTASRDHFTKYCGSPEYEGLTDNFGNSLDNPTSDDLLDAFIIFANSNQNYLYDSDCTGQVPTICTKVQRALKHMPQTCWMALEGGQSFLDWIKSIGATCQNASYAAGVANRANQSFLDACPTEARTLMPVPAIKPTSARIVQPPTDRPKSGAKNNLDRFDLGPTFVSPDSSSAVSRTARSAGSSKTQAKATTSSDGTKAPQTSGAPMAAGGGIQGTAKTTGTSDASKPSKTQKSLTAPIVGGTQGTVKEQVGGTGGTVKDPIK